MTATTEIKDAAHGVRVLKALVEQGEQKLGFPHKLYEPWMSMVLALIEGAKVIISLKQSPDFPSNPDLVVGETAMKEGTQMLFAEAVARRMEKAGMEVPK